MKPTRTPRAHRIAAVCMLALAGVTQPGASSAQSQPPAHPPARHAPAPGNRAPDSHAPRSRPPVNPGWHGDIRHFGDHDWHVWRNGRWVHGHHSGHPGWWWVVGPTWYFYPTPIYPYPNPYEPPPPWSPALPVPVVPPAQFWYFCDESQRYYPYVSTCPGGWRQVPVTQAPAASPAER